MNVLRRYIPKWMLALAALVALWQNHRARRSVRETHPPHEVPLPEPAPHVSIILPVRDEEANIDTCLASLLAQDYPCYDVIVIDDGSTDATPRLLAAWQARDKRVRVQRVEKLPAGWAGKAHALHTGVELAHGAWLLFTDADTWHSPGTLRLMVGHALRQQVDMLSMHTNLMTISGLTTHLLMPITEVLLAQRVTPAEMSDPASPRSFAFGQYILLRRAAYVETGGYAAAGTHTTSVDDLALAEQFKRYKLQVEVVNGRGLVKNRQWTTWESARTGWEKSYFGVIVLARIPFAGLPAGLALVAYGLGPLLTLLKALTGGKVRRLSAVLAAITVLAQIDAKRCFDHTYDLAFPWSLTAPAGWLVCGAMALDTTRLILTGRRASWKGRQVPRQEAPSRVAVYTKAWATATAPSECSIHL